MRSDFYMDPLLYCDMLCYVVRNGFVSLTRQRRVIVMANVHIVTLFISAN